MQTGCRDKVAGEENVVSSEENYYLVELTIIVLCNPRCLRFEHPPRPSAYSTASSDFLSESALASLITFCWKYVAARAANSIPIQLIYWSSMGALPGSATWPHPVGAQCRSRWRSYTQKGEHETEVPIASTCRQRETRSTERLSRCLQAGGAALFSSASRFAAGGVRAASAKLSGI